MCTIDIVIGSLIAVCTTQRHTLYHLELWQFGQSSQHIHHIRIREYLVTHLQKISQILDSWRNTVDEMLLAFEIAAESVGAQTCKVRKSTKRLNRLQMAHRWYLGIMLQ